MDQVPADVRREIATALHGLASAIDEGQANPQPLIGTAIKVWAFAGHVEPKGANGGLAVSVNVTAARLADLEDDPAAAAARARQAGA